MPPSPLPNKYSKLSLQPGTSFIAIDFETADYGADSACAIGVVTASNGKIVDSQHFLIRPPRKEFVFSYLHGIEWQHVADKPTFAELWPRLQEYFKDALFIAAHNAGFDRKVLYTCCESAGITPPQQHFVCSMKLARQTWNLYPTRLPHVCQFLGITLDHHNALSDAEACARIVLAAKKN